MVRPISGLVVAVLVSSTGAWAQDAEPSPDAVQVALPSSDAERDAPLPEPRAAPKAKRLPPRFMEQYLSYDEGSQQARQGRARRPLSRAELYQTLGRADLSAELVRLQNRKRGLLLAGGVVTVAATAGAVALFLTGPDINGAPCQQNIHAYNACIGRKDVHQELAAASLVVAVLGAVGLVTSGLFTPQAPIAPAEESRLAHEFNAKLLEAPRSAEVAPPVKLELAPYASVSGGGIAVAGRF